MKTVFIMRGISGSGKSTVAKKLAAREYICSTDEYFMVNGEYKFDRSKLGEYHKRNFELFSSFVEVGVQTLVVDNTNCKRSEFEKYADKAVAHGYVVLEVCVGNPWRQNKEKDMRYISTSFVEACIARNGHNVPSESVWQQARNFEP